LKISLAKAKAPDKSWNFSGLQIVGKWIIAGLTIAKLSTLVYKRKIYICELQKQYQFDINNSIQFNSTNTTRLSGM